MHSQREQHNRTTLLEPTKAPPVTHVSSLKDVTGSSPWIMSARRAVGAV